MDELNFGIYKVNLTRYEYDKLINKAYVADLMIDYLLSELELSGYVTPSGEHTVNGTVSVDKLLKIVAPKKFADRLTELVKEADNA